MFGLKNSIVCSAALTAAVWAPAATAQSIPEGGPDPASVGFRIGPVLVTPRIQLVNLGVDTNVFNEADDQNPKEDFTFTFQPSADFWMRIGRSWLLVNIREDLVWFQTYASERSATTSHAVRWRMPLNRLIVEASPEYLNTRERPGFEIDARPKRREYGAKALVEVRAFSRMFVGVTGSWRKTDFDQDARFLNSLLRFELNRTVTTGGVSVRNELTPLTSVTLSVTRAQDRFEFSPLRDSNSTGVNGSVSFDPHALIRGTATVGFRNFHPLSPGLADYKGTTAGGDLSYTLLGATRFAVQFRRDISYSYDINQPYYLETAFGASVAQQIHGPVDVVGRIGAARLAYTDRAGAAVAVPDRIDHVQTYGGGVGYHFGSDVRVGFNIDQQRRLSDLGRRRYDALRYGASLTYGF